MGLFSGVINTLAGGGSLITLPVMILGIPPTIANGTNRVQLIQNIFAVYGFNRKAYLTLNFWWLSMSAVLGSIIGVL